MWWNSPRPPCLTGTVMKNLLPSLENTGSSFYNGEGYEESQNLDGGAFYFLHNLLFDSELVWEIEKLFENKRHGI